MDDTRNITQDGQEDVDEEVAIAAALKEDSERGQEDGEDDLDEVARGICQLKVSESSQEFLRRKMIAQLTLL